MWYINNISTSRDRNVYGTEYRIYRKHQTHKYKLSAYIIDYSRQWVVKCWKKIVSEIFGKRAKLRGILPVFNSHINFTNEIR